VTVLLGENGSGKSTIAERSQLTVALDREAGTPR